MDTNRDRGESLTLMLMLISSPAALLHVHLKIVGRWWRWVGIHGFARMKNGNTFALIKPIYKPGPQPAT